MISKLNRADPMIVPVHILSHQTVKIAISAVKNSGALLPTAISVAHATSSLRRILWAMVSKLPTK
jgi:hypothetical protein